MITSWPSGPSPQISTSGSKSGLSLYANVASCNPLFHPHPPANQGPPCWRACHPIAALRLTMPSKINIKPFAGDKRGQISEGTGATEGLRRILSGYPTYHPLSLLSVYSTTLASSKATSNYFSAKCADWTTLASPRGDIETALEGWWWGKRGKGNDDRSERERQDVTERGEKGASN